MVYLSDEEKKRIQSCLNNIIDKIKAIQVELCGDKAYKFYLAEKSESALNDIKVINHICGEEEERSI